MSLNAAVQAFAALKSAKTFPNEKALEKYLHDHPDADKSKHRVNDDSDAEKDLKDYKKNFIDDRSKKDKSKKDRGDKKHDDDLIESLKKYKKDFMDDREKGDSKEAGLSDLLKSVQAFQVVAKTAALDADTLLEIQDALDGKDGKKARSALNGLKGVQSAVYLLNAMKRKGINVNEALKTLGG